MRLAVPAALALAGCATSPAPPGNGESIAGTWRAASGHTLSISRFFSFATRRGCAVTGGMLQPVGTGRFRIERYDTGFSSDECGRWRAGPEIAPFDGIEVRLERIGDRLVATGPIRRVTFRWLGPSPV